MTLNAVDERDLLLPLLTGIEEEPVWGTFLRRLLARTRAQRVHLFIRPGGAVGLPVIQRTIRAHGYVPGEVTFNLETFNEADLLPYASLRPHRVYSLEETNVRESAEIILRQRAVLDAASVAYARFIRIVAPGDHNAWLVLLHGQVDFGASDSALLSSLAPHFRLALLLLMDMRGLRLRATIAEEALAQIGVGQAIFDSEGRVVLSDLIAAEQLDFKNAPQPRIRAGTGQELNAACRELSAAPREMRRTVRFDDRLNKNILLRRAPIDVEAALGGGYYVGLVRQPKRESATSAAQVAAATLGLSKREAALAEAISQGRSIAEAGAELRLTLETARLYSKRIYAKTGARGQADLVRILLTGLVPFA
jgi:DNA-binding CsgD family transcriptional regulator